MTLGIGYTFAGISYAGYGLTPATADEPGPEQGAAYVDQNGDYQVNGTGDLVKTSYTAQRALVLLRTVVASASVDPKIGMVVHNAIDAAWEYKMRRACENALSPMVDDATIRIDNIEINKTTPIRCSIVISYTVLATGKTELVRI